MSNESNDKPEPKPIVQIEVLPADTPLASGTIYPKEVLLKAIHDIKPFLVMDMVLGEFNPETVGDSVNASDASHVVKNLYFRDNMLVAEMEILPTAQGQQLMVALTSGASVGSVSRGVADIEETPEGDMVKEYSIITVDAFTSDSPEE